MGVMERGALGEFVSAIVVFGSLVFVGPQIRRTVSGIPASSLYPASPPRPRS